MHAGVDKAKVVVCTIPDDALKGTTNRVIVAAVRQINPGAIIIANAIELEDYAMLYDAGTDYVFLQGIETQGRLVWLPARHRPARSALTAMP